MKIRLTLMFTSLVCWAFCALVLVTSFIGCASVPKTGPSEMAILGAVINAATPKYLTFNCTPAADEVTSAQLQFNSDALVNAPLVSTCGSDPATKVTCTGLSKTICYPNSLWPAGAFSVKAQVSNIRDVSGFSLPLNVPTVPSSPSSLREVR